VVSGTVRRLGDRVRVTAQLIDARTDRHLWTGEFEREVKDFMKMETELAHAIANEIRVEISQEAHQRAETLRSVDPEAIDAYMRGRAQQDLFTEEGQTAAFELYQRAIEIAPDFALAYAAISATYIDMVGARLPAKQAMPAAKAAAQKALELDPDLPEALASLATVRTYWEWDWNAAEKDLDRAIQLRPNSARIHHDRGMYFIVVGRFEAALDALKRAQELDPHSHTVRIMVPWPLYFLRRYDELIEANRAIVQAGDSLDPGPYFGMAIGHVEKKEFAEAVSTLQHAARLDPLPHVLAMLGYTYAASGDAMRAREALARLDSIPEAEHALRALVYAGLGDNDEALALLERAFEEREHTLIFFVWNPCFDGLRNEPRFVDLLRRMGLPSG
jgi:tetratricopeptide (TPR) repeat protein